MDPKTKKLQEQLLRFVGGYLQKHGYQPEEWNAKPIPTDGSTRMFLRIMGPDPDMGLVAMANPPTEDFLRQENQAYLAIGRHLRKRGVAVPQVLAHNLLRGFFLVSDLGTRNLQMVARQEADPIPHYEKVLDELLKLQVNGVSGFDQQWCCQTPKYDTYVMRSLESGYFAKAFLIGYLGLKRDLSFLDPDFDYLAQMASLSRADYLIHRDFQSRNIIVHKDKIGFVDWQGARLGPPAYDLASLLIDPYVNLNDSVREILFERYAKALEKIEKALAEDLRQYYLYIAVQRNLQVLGAFGYLTKVKRKAQFAQYIPPAIATLNRLLDMLSDPRLANLQNFGAELPERLRERSVAEKT